MSKRRIFLKYDESGKLIPKSLTISQDGKFPMGGSYVETLRQSCCCQNNLAEVVIGNLPEGSTIDDFIDLLSGGGITFTNCTICTPTCPLKLSELGNNIGNYVLFGSVESTSAGLQYLTNESNPDFSLSLDCCPNIIVFVETYFKYAEAFITYNLDLCCNNVFASIETYLKYEDALPFLGYTIPVCGCTAYLGNVFGHFLLDDSGYAVTCENNCLNAISSYSTYEEEYCTYFGISPVSDPTTGPIDYISYNLPFTSCNYTPSLQSCVLGLQDNLGITDLQALLNFGILEVPGVSNEYSACEIENWLNEGLSSSELLTMFDDPANGIAHLTQHSSKNIGEKITQLLANDIPYSVIIPPGSNIGIQNILDKGMIQTGDIFDGKDVFYGIEDLRSFCSTLNSTDFAVLIVNIFDKGLVEIGALGGESIFYKFLEIIKNRTDLMASAPPDQWITVLLDRGVKIQFADNCEITVSFIRDP